VRFSIRTAYVTATALLAGLGVLATQKWLSEVSLGWVAFGIAVLTVVAGELAHQSEAARSPRADTDVPSPVAAENHAPPGGAGPGAGTSGGSVPTLGTPVQADSEPRDIAE
jgi:hypothetical protein